MAWYFLGYFSGISGGHPYPFYPEVPLRGRNYTWLKQPATINRMSYLCTEKLEIEEQVYAAAYFKENTWKTVKES